MKGYKLFVVILIGVLFIFSACKKTSPPAPVYVAPAPDFILQLKAKYGNQNFEMNSFYTDPAGRFLQIESLEFYLSNINLIKSNGTLVPISKVAIFDFTDTTALTVIDTNIQGDFTGISFACGLDSLMNDTTTPYLYNYPNPLSGYYGMPWLMLKYQFEILDGLWDTQDTAPLRNALIYHIGTNAAYRQTQLNKTFSVSSSNPYTMVIYLDVKQIFYNSTTPGDSISVVTESASMSTSPPASAPVIMSAFATNFSQAFTFNGP